VIIDTTLYCMWLAEHNTKSTSIRTQYCFSRYDTMNDYYFYLMRWHINEHLKQYKQRWVHILYVVPLVCIVKCCDGNNSEQAQIPWWEFKMVFV